MRRRRHRKVVEILPRLEYLLRVWRGVDIADQGYANAQVIDAVAEGRKEGQLTIVEVDGTIAAVSNRCAFTAQGTPAWGDLGAYSQAVARVMGRGLLCDVNCSGTATTGPLLGFADAGVLGVGNWVYVLNFSSPAELHPQVWDGAGGVQENVIAAYYAATTDYAIAIVLGGYDLNGVPWYAGANPVDYAYGVAFFIVGGVFATWTLLWRSAKQNMTPLYAILENREDLGSLAGFIDDLVDFSPVLQPQALSTFTAPNGTSLDAITPEVGGVWTEDSGDWNIQGNEATVAGVNGYATVDSGISDALIDVTIHTGTENSNPGGLIARFTDTDNCWILRPRSGDPKNLYLVERVAGVNTVRASVGVVINADTDYDLRLICDGQQIDGFIDGANQISYGLAAFQETATKHGFRTMVITDTYDNFHVAPRTGSVYDREFDRA